MHRLPAQIFLMLTLSALPALSALPSQPVNQAPTTGATDVALIPVLESSAFSDLDLGDVHTASQWQIDDNFTFASPNFDSATETVHLTSIRVIGGSLRPGMLYFWRVRYLDGGGSWSEWSTGTHFRLIDSVALQVPADYSTVQAALDAAQEGETILVRGGRYFENIHFTGKNVVLTSLEPTDPEVVAATILDGSRSGSVVRFVGTEISTCVLTGFTITNGAANVGSGINGARTRAKIAYNAITENTAPGGLLEGAGIHNCGGLIEHNLISKNSVIRGEGGGLYGCAGEIRYNIIRDNRAEHGAGLAACGGLIHHNQVLDNRAVADRFEDNARGGGFYRCGGQVSNNIVIGNRASEGAGFHSCGCAVDFCTIYANSAFNGVSFYDCTGTIKNSIVGGGHNGIEQTRQPTFCCFTGWDGVGEGNFQAEPRLVDFAGGDYSLEPDSPCIDAGSFSSITIDFTGEARGHDATDRPRGDGTDNDIGAFEFIGTASPNPLPDRPVNVSPPDGSSPLGYLFDLVSSPFSDDNPDDFHVASDWEISLASDFADIWGALYYTQGALTRLAALVDDEPFPSGMTFWWRVRYANSYGDWTESSVPTSFTTRTGTIVHVPEDFQTIQSAIDNGIDGDEIVVATGTYVENIDYIGKDILLRSTDPQDASVVAQTVLKGETSLKPTVLFSRIENKIAYGELSGFTIHGYNLGIVCTANKSTISYNVIKDGGISDTDGHILNNRFEGGFGIFDPDDALIEGNTILSGGIQGQFSHPIIRNNLLTGIDGQPLTECHGLIEGNTITHNGYGAIFHCDGIIRSNLIAFNTTPGRFSDRAGIAYCDGTIESNLICFNRTDATGGGISSCDALIRNNFVCDNFAAEGAAGLSKCGGLIINNTVLRNVAIHGVLNDCA